MFLIILSMHLQHWLSILPSTRYYAKHVKLSIDSDVHGKYSYINILIHSDLIKYIVTTSPKSWLELY